MGLLGWYIGGGWPRLACWDWQSPGFDPVTTLVRSMGRGIERSCLRFLKKLWEHLFHFFVSAKNFNKIDRAESPKDRSHVLSGHSAIKSETHGKIFVLVNVQYLCSPRTWPQGQRKLPIAWLLMNRLIFYFACICWQGTCRHVISPDWTARKHSNDLFISF